MVSILLKRKLDYIPRTQSLYIWYIQLNNAGLNCMDPLIHTFFSRYTVKPPYPWVLHHMIQLNLN